MGNSSGLTINRLFEGQGEMRACCRALDWTQTSLGPVTTWPASLQTIVQMVLASPFPGIILWGPDLTQVYNDEFRQLMGDKHPAALGQRHQDCWPESWRANQSVYQRVLAGESVCLDDVPHPHNNAAGADKAWFKVAYTPLSDDTGSAAGILITLFETTSVVAGQNQRQLHARKKDYLLLLGEALRPLMDPHVIQYEAVSVLGKFLGASRAGYAETLVDKELVTVTVNYTAGVEGIEGIYRYSDYGNDLLVRLMEGQTVVRQDIAHDPGLSEAEKEAHAVLQLGATLNVPLVKAGKLVAILFVHFQQAYHFSEQDIALAEETAERTWAAVERARAEAGLRISEQQLSAIVNQARTGFARGNGDGTFTFVNQRYCEMLGYRADELIGRKMQEFTHPDDRARNIRLFFRLVETGEPFDIEKRYIRKDGSAIWVHNSVSAIRNQDGQIEQILAVSTEITDRKMAEAALRASEQEFRELSIQLEARVKERTKQLELSIAELKRSNDNLQQFAYIASHDLQEPLRKIQQFGGRLKESIATPGKDGVLYLERMLSAAGRMSTLINDLLDFSRISMQTGQPELVVLDMLISDVLTTLEYTINEQKARIVQHPLPKVSGDAMQLSQLFQNLLSNALKFHQPGVAPVVEIRAGRVDRAHLPDDVRPGKMAAAYECIEVCDNGIGFDEQYSERIFKMFQRLHGRSEFQGTGIGLAICEKVVANHGGAILAHSQPGKGATFSVYLPALEEV